HINVEDQAVWSRHLFAPRHFGEQVFVTSRVHYSPTPIVYLQSGEAKPCADAWLNVSVGKPSGQAVYRLPPRAMAWNDDLGVHVRQFLDRSCVDRGLFAG